METRWMEFCTLCTFIFVATVTAQVFVKDQLSERQPIRVAKLHQQSSIHQSSSDPNIKSNRLLQPISSQETRQPESTIHSRQKRMIWITDDGRLALPPGTVLSISPTISMPLVRYPPSGFLSNLTMSFPLTSKFCLYPKSASWKCELNTLYLQLTLTNLDLPTMRTLSGCCLQFLVGPWDELPAPCWPIMSENICIPAGSVRLTISRKMKRTLRIYRKLTAMCSTAESEPFCTEWWRIWSKHLDSMGKPVFFGQFVKYIRSRFIIWDYLAKWLNYFLRR